MILKPTMQNTMSYIRQAKTDVQSKTKMAAAAILNFTYYAANSLLSTGFHQILQVYTSHNG
jgi:hypothetical protein